MVRKVELVDAAQGQAPPLPAAMVLPAIARKAEVRAAVKAGRREVEGGVAARRRDVGRRERL